MSAGAKRRDAGSASAGARRTSARSSLLGPLAAAHLAALALVACAEGERETALLVERTAEAGIDFVHVHGGVGNRELPETMGGGVALIDHDADGDLDAYFAQSGPVRLPDGSESRRGSRNALYANDGTGRFARVQGAAGAGDPGYGQGCAVADVDGDGWDDVLSLNWGPNSLYRNGGGRFEDATARAGLKRIDEWSVSAAFFDAEGDGDLDLYVVNYVYSPPAYYRALGDPEGFRGYPHPDRFQGQADRFHRNRGGGRFDDETQPAGFHRASGKGLGVVPTDVDLDGFVDLYVANDSTPNFLFHNRGGERFEERGVELGVAFNDDGLTEAGMGIDTGDVDEDGDFDLFVTNLAGETNTLYVNRSRSRGPDGTVRTGRLGFADRTAQAGLTAPSFDLVGFGALFCDVDGDAHLDLLVVNGHVLDNAHQVVDTRTYAQPNQLFLGDGSGRFEVLPPERAGPGLERPTVSRGCAVGDLDGDGRADFVIATSNGPAQVFLGARPAGPDLRLALAGPPSNPRGLGASVWLELADGRRLLRRIEASRSYASSSEPVLTTGLPADLRAVEVLWPGGARERWSAEGRPAGTWTLAHGSGERRP